MLLLALLPTDELDSFTWHAVVSEMLCLLVLHDIFHLVHY